MVLNDVTGNKTGPLFSPREKRNDDKMILKLKGKNRVTKKRKNREKHTSIKDATKKKVRLAFTVKKYCQKILQGENKERNIFSIND